jgi:hypothetical protein
MTAVFGDFLTLANEHITAAAILAADLPARARPGITTGLSRLVTIMAKYATDPAQPDPMYRPALRPRPDGQVTAPECHTALTRAAQAMTAATHPAASARRRTQHPAEARLHTAADCLAAGRDLLKTHFPGLEIPAAVGSSWAPVITSVPVTIAMQAELASYATQLAPLTARLALPSPDGTPREPTDRALCAASNWLHVAAATITRQQVPPEADRLLRAVPANLLPPRCVPSGEETITDLCAGATSTAERLRHLVLRSAPARWPPAATSTSWRRGSLAAAILGHTSEIILRTLATRARQLTHSRSLAPGLKQAADAMRETWTAWQAIACDWDTLSTGTAMTLSPVAAELGDLVLWTGRIARTDSAWTPARSQASQIRTPADLAPTTADIATILAAVERAASLTAVVAHRDSEAVRHAAAERGIYIPTRLLPETDTGPIRRYHRVPRPRIKELLAAYDTATRAGDQATALLHDLVVVADAPGAIAAATRLTTLDLPAASVPLTHSSEPEPDLRAPRLPDELQHHLRSLHITDPALLRRATVIDQATQNLIAEANAKLQQRATTNPAPMPRAPNSRSSATRLARQDIARPLNRVQPAAIVSQRGNQPGAGQPAAGARNRPA